jgi:competence protein ComEA
MRLIAVYVSGAVAAPGVYNVPDGSRVDKAVAAAGGALEDADLNRINMAARLSDEDHIIVYRQGEAIPATVVAVGAATRTPGPGVPATTRPERAPTTPPSNQAAKPSPAVKINVNTATAIELEQIPGIGPALAQRIITDRETNGPFTSVEDLTRINGIKEGVLARLRPYVSVTP